MPSSEQLIDDLYCELRRLAAAKLSRLPPGQTLQATALVHEAYLRISSEPSQSWENPVHFFASAAQAMRRIPIEQARRKAAGRRPGHGLREPFGEINIAAPEPEDRLLAVNQLLDVLALKNPFQAELVKLRFFGGLKHSEVAALLDISEKTARREWNEAKRWLYQQISDQNDNCECHSGHVVLCEERRRWVFQ